MKKIIISVVCFLSVFTGQICSAKTTGWVLISDFDEGVSFNSLGGVDFSFADPGSSLDAFYFNADINVVFQNKGRSLQLKYNILKDGAAAWGTTFPNIDISQYSNLTFRIKLKTMNLEGITIALKDLHGNLSSVALEGFVNRTEKWQKVEIPLNSFQGNDLSKSTGIRLVFTDAAGKGEFYIDTLGFTRDKKKKSRVPFKKKEIPEEIEAPLEEQPSPETEEPVETGVGARRAVPEQREPAVEEPVETGEGAEGEVAKASPDEGWTIFDQMDEIGQWGHGGEEGSRHSLALTDGKFNKAIELSYDFRGKTWLQIFRPIKKDLSGIEKIKLWIKGSGKINNMELKFTDKDGSTFGYRFKKFSVHEDWKKVELAYKDIGYFWGGDKKLDLTNLDSLYLAVTKEEGGKGKVLIDKIAFKLPASTLSQVKLGRVSRVTIDDFERANPLVQYSILEGDESVLKLTSDRLRQEGLYSMKYEYGLEAARGSPSYVLAGWTAKEPLDWRGVQKLVIWVLGDGSENIFRINVIDADNEVYTYASKNILRYTGWRKLTIPLKVFRRAGGSKQQNNRFDVRKIKRYELVIEGWRPETSNGFIYVDNFYVTGKDLDPLRVAPPKEISKIFQKGGLGNIDFSGFMFNQYRYTPEENHRMEQYMRLNVDAHVGRFTARSEIVSRSFEFGEVSARIDTDGTIVRSNSLFEIGLLKLSAHNLHPNITEIVYGDVDVNYDKYTFNGVSGFKGLSLRGQLDNFDYDAFFVKHRYDKFGAGARLSTYYKDTLLRTTFVHHQSTAKVTGGSIIVGQAALRTVLKTEPVLEDSVVTLEAERYFLKQKIKIRGMYGYNRYVKMGVSNNSNIFESTYIGRLDPVDIQRDKMIEAGVDIKNLPWKDLTIQYLYRDIGTYFKPFYRQDPNVFDDINSDLKSYNIRGIQGYKGYVGTLEYEHLTRISSALNWSRKFVAKIGKYGWHGFDVELSQELQREIYNFKSNRSDFNENSNEDRRYTEFYVSYVSYNGIKKMRLWAKYRFENVTLPAQDHLRYDADIFNTKLEFFPTSAVKLFAEYKFTRYARPEFEAPGETDDNFGKITLEFDF